MPFEIGRNHRTGAACVAIVASARAGGRAGFAINVNAIVTCHRLAGGTSVAFGAGMLLLLVMAMIVSLPSASPDRSDPVLVRFVIDGDTIDVAGVGRVRLLGIDAPEIGSRFETPAPFAIEAKNRLVDLVASRWVRLEYDAIARDGYNRRLAYVLIDRSMSVNEILVREGLARVSARIPLSRLGDLKRAEAEARNARRGIWRAATLQPSERYVVPRPKTPPKKRSPITSPCTTSDSTSRSAGLCRAGSRPLRCAAASVSRACDPTRRGSLSRRDGLCPS
jgi:endonuclease YncB( thermonuclease family)